MKKEIQKKVKFTLKMLDEDCPDKGGKGERTIDTWTYIRPWHLSFHFFLLISYFLLNFSHISFWLLIFSKIILYSG